MNNIKFSAINVRPYSAWDALAEEFPAKNLIDGRHDFYYDDFTSRIAVVIQATNDMYGSSDYNPTRQIFTVSLCHGDTVLSSSNLSMKLERWTQSDAPRVDIPVGHLKLEVGRVYDVRVAKRGSKKVLIGCPLRFFPIGGNMSEMVDVEGCYVLADGRSCRNVVYFDHEEMSVCFVLKNRQLDWDNMPEMLVDIYDKEGQPETFEGEVERIENQETGSGDRFRVKVPLEVTGRLKGIIYAELKILGAKVAGMVFTTNDKEETGIFQADETVPYSEYTAQEGEYVMLQRQKAQAESEQTEVMKFLDSLVGLRNVKSKIREYTELVRFNNLRREASLPCMQPTLHAMFTGSPGTGKTTIAKIMGQMLKGIGALSSGHVVVRERSTLLGQNYSSESENTLAAIREAQGGILFIDEAYQLYQPNDPRDPGKFVIETLMTALADEDNRDWMLILAGYTKPMMKMFEMNPGLASRIPPTNIYAFDDYSPEELLEIAERYFDLNKFILTAEAADALKMLVNADYAHREPNFGNARYVMNVINTGIIPAMARRIASVGTPSAEMLSKIELSDIPRPLKPNLENRRSIGFETRRVLA